MTRPTFQECSSNRWTADPDAKADPKAAEVTEADQKARRAFYGTETSMKPTQSQLLATARFHKRMERVFASLGKTTDATSARRAARRAEAFRATKEDR